MEFNKKEFESFRKDAKEALGEVEKKYGIFMDFGAIGYNENEFKFQVRVIKAEDDKLSREQNAFNHECKQFGFSESDYKMIISMNNHRYELIGFNPNGRKNVCIIRSISNNNIYLCSAETIIKHVISK